MNTTKMEEDIHTGHESDKSESDELVVYVTESGWFHDGGSVESVFKTLEGAIASKPSKYSKYVEPEKNKNGVTVFSWYDKGENEYFTIYETIVSDEIPETLKMITCSYNGCRFRPYNFYFSYDLNKSYKDICSECGEEATANEVSMHKAMK